MWAQHFSLLGAEGQAARSADGLAGQYHSILPASQPCYFFVGETVTNVGYVKFLSSLLFEHISLRFTEVELG